MQNKIKTKDDVCWNCIQRVADNPLEFGWIKVENELKKEYYHFECPKGYKTKDLKTPPEHCNYPVEFIVASQKDVE